MECHRADRVVVLPLADEAVHVNHWAALSNGARWMDVITERFIVQCLNIVVSFSSSVHVDRAGRFWLIVLQQGDKYRINFSKIVLQE